MARILIWKKITPHNEVDIFRMSSSKEFYNVTQSLFDGNPYNVGNKLWFQGLISEIDDGINQIEYRTDDMNSDYINQTYDLIIYPMANVFYEEYAPYLNDIAESFKAIKIPTFVIACGVQAKSYDDLDRLVDSIKGPSKAFIDAIYKTGGEFALRGCFSKEFFDKLGYKDAVVTGCPSLYQMGRNLTINNEKVSLGKFKPVLNGKLDLVKTYLLDYKDSIYIDQDMYINLLFSLEQILADDSYSVKSFKQPLLEYNRELIELALNSKIHYFTNMPVWKNELVEKGFNFSYGARIHGNIMSILSGIPAVVYPCDSRTREMAEFYDIPVDGIDVKSNDLYEKYLETDYTKFNNSFSQKFDFYEQFLINHGIITGRINSNNVFFNQKISSEAQNTFNNDFYELNNFFDSKKGIIDFYAMCLRILNRML